MPTKQIAKFILGQHKNIYEKAKDKYEVRQIFAKHPEHFESDEIEKYISKKNIEKYIEDRHFHQRWLPDEIFDILSTK